MTITPFGLGYKARVYSPNRVKYPLKRVDWDPDGDRQPPEPAGKSKYVRISWDEAAEIVAKELKRHEGKIRPRGSAVSRADMHGEGKRVAPSHGCPNRLLSPHGRLHPPDAQHGLLGGVVLGGTSMSGAASRLARWPRTANLYPDIAQHSDSCSCSGAATRRPHPWAWSVPYALPAVLLAVSDLGMKSVYVCPGPQLCRRRPCG